MNNHTGQTTVTLPNALIDELLNFSPATSMTEAVATAIRNTIHRKRLEAIIVMADKAEFSSETVNYRHNDHRLG